MDRSSYMNHKLADWILEKQKAETHIQFTPLICWVLLESGRVDHHGSFPFHFRFQHFSISAFQFLPAPSPLPQFLVLDRDVFRVAQQPDMFPGGLADFCGDGRML